VEVLCTEIRTNECETGGESRPCFDFIKYHQGNDRGVEWRPFCLDFSRLSTRDLRFVIVTKNQLPNVLMRTFDQISEIKHSYENVWQLIFCHNDEAKVASGQSRDKRAIQPLCHSLGTTNDIRLGNGTASDPLKIVIVDAL